MVAANAVTGDVPTYEPHRTRKSSTKVLVGTVALLVPIAAAAFWMSQRSDETPAVGSSPPVAAAIVDSVPQAQAQPDSAVPVQPPVAAPVVVDSQAIKDSLRKRAQAAKLAAARADSLRQKAAQNTTKVATPVDNRVVAARRAAANLLADPNARAAFMRGATRRGGPLGTRRKGDLQTQIDALQPFLSSAGLTYNEFKQIVQESGFTIFDQFGRIEPGALARFSNGN